LFNFEEYANSEGIEFKLGPGDERIIDCVICGKKKHMYFNISKNLFDCKVCGEAGNHLRFVMAHQDVSFTRAIEIIEGYAKSVSISKIKNRIKKIKEKFLNIDIDSYNKHKQIIKIPRDAIPITNSKYPIFFSRRGYDKSIIFKMNNFVCEKGRYSGRIIFPFTCDGSESFVAYASNEFIKPKTLNPFGSDNSSLIYGYDLFKNSKNLVIVEGITDAIRLWHWGISSVALLGKNISDEHIYLLYKHNAIEITLCLDGDVEEHKLMEKFHKLASNIPKIVTIAMIKDKDKDPDKLTKKEFFDIYDNRKTFFKTKFGI